MKQNIPVLPTTADTTRPTPAQMDAADPLSGFRERFFVPKTRSGADSIYFTGNSLGLQPRTVSDYVARELDDWKNLGVEGHLKAKSPWLPYHELLAGRMAEIVGAEPAETVVMNSLTVNLHLLMVSFFRPDATRRKIVIEKGAFPSDRYAVWSQLRFHNLDPAENLIELEPRRGESTLRTQDIADALENNGDSVALVMLGGVNYYTGQAFDIKAVTEAAHKIGAVAAFDLAHAAGNIELRLHDWNVDFAAWCSYKYLNGGPGAVGGVFVHGRHAFSFDLPRFAGWWGHDKQTRFQMGPEFRPIAGAEGWQISNPPILQMAALRASLEIFAEAGMQALTEKSRALTDYLETLLDELNEPLIRVITPRDALQRGCQLSIRVENSKKELFSAITQRGVIADWREPDVIRVAPTPLYNSFSDVYEFVEILKQCLK